MKIQVLEKITTLRLRLILVVFSILLFCFWGIIIKFESRNLQTVYNHETQFNHQYLNLLQDNLQQNIYFSDVIQNEFLKRNEIIIRHSMHKFDKQEITSLMKLLEIDYLLIMNKKGRIVHSIPSDSKFPYSLQALEVNKGLFVYTPPDSSRWIYMVMNEKGHYYITRVSKKNYMRLIGPLTLDNIFKELSKQINVKGVNDTFPEIEYIAIQDTEGIIAASSKVDKISSIKGDSFLKDILAKNIISTRQVVFNKALLIETAMPFHLADNEEVIIRMGTSYDRIQQFKEQLHFDLVFYSILLLIFFAIELVFYKQYVKYRKVAGELHISQKTYEIGKLGGDVAHEIKNPIHNINLLLQRIKDNPQNQENIVSSCSIASQQIDYINKTIERFLSYSRPIKINYQRITITEFIESVCEVMDPQLKAKGVELIIIGNKESTWNLDSGITQIILTNLIKNSLEEFKLEQIGKKIEIEWQIESAKLVIFVRDNAGGIETSDIEQIWDLYFTTKKDGSGIGLPICRKYIELLGGSITINNHHPKGLTVILDIPKTEVNNESSFN